MCLSTGARGQYVDVLGGASKPVPAAPGNLFAVLPKSASMPANIFVPNALGNVLLHWLNVCWPFLYSGLLNAYFSYYYYRCYYYYIYKYISVARDRTIQQMCCADSYTVNTNVFSLFLNVSNVMSHAHSSSGTLFHTQSPWTAKLWSPQFINGTVSRAELLDWWLWMSACNTCEGTAGPCGADTCTPGGYSLLGVRLACVRYRSYDIRATSKVIHETCRTSDSRTPVVNLIADLRHPRTRRTTSRS